MNRIRSTSGLLVAVGVSISLPSPLAFPSAHAADAASPISTELRLTSSDDGRNFRPGGSLLCANAANAALTQLPDGSLLALFDWRPDSESRDEVVMAVTRSGDGGRTWSAPRGVDLRDRAGEEIAGRSGSLIAVRKNLLRLYFMETAPKRENDRNPSRTRFRTAVTRDGLHYRVVDECDAPIRGDANTRNACLRYDKRIHLFSMSEARDSGVSLQHYVSRDGRRFEREAAGEIEERLRLGSVLHADGGLFAYVSTGSGVELLQSADGARWEPLERSAFESGADPAVVRLKDGTYLMVVTVASGGSIATENPLAGTADRYAGDNWTTVDGSETPDAFESMDSADAEWSEGDADAEAVAAIGADVEAPEVVPAYGVFAPVPNFRKPVDYIAWFKKNIATAASDNAADAYATFLPGFGENANEDPQWIGVTALVDGLSPTYPTPWNAEDEPEREAARLEAQSLLDAFRAASLHAGYATTVQFLPRDGSEEQKPLLLDLVLPSLRSHRELSKAILAEAWRTEDGSVSADNMLEAAETVFRDADHLHHGITLIEDLVGVAEESLARKNLRCALQQGVFDDEQSIENALNMLESMDGEPRDPALLLRGEHAFAMDMIQYMFSPADENGEPKANVERIHSLDSQFLGDDAPSDALTDVTGEEVRRLTQTINGHYERLGGMMRTGYPLVRGTDVEAATNEVRATGTLAETVVPSLTRYYQLRALSEAERRATRLSFAVQLFHKQNDRWPESFDELSAGELDEIRTDPFTGADFGYRVGPDGPTIYTLSENGIDDGGIHSKSWIDETDPETGSDDRVYWPPQE